MEDFLKIKLYAFTLDCPDPHALAAFYAALLKWEPMKIDEDWACVFAPGTEQGAYPSMLFQKNDAYVPPVWPETPDAQQQMAHMDFAVNDVEQAVRHAITCGASIAEEQYSEHWRVMLDPSGHPFCLCQMKSLMESEHFALR